MVLCGVDGMMPRILFVLLLGQVNAQTLVEHFLKYFQ